MKRLLAVALWVAVCNAKVDIPSGFDTNFCQVPPHNGGKNFPKIPNDYVTKLEWNDHVERKSTYMSEYVSVTNNIGATYITGVKYPGITTKYITSASTGELFMIYNVDAQEFEDGNCVVKKLDNTEEFALPFKKDPNVPGTDTLLDGRSLLNLGADPVGSMMYNGTEVMNGIPCDVWVGCLYIVDGAITIAVKYHFSDESWNTAGGSVPAPIGIHAKGTSLADKKYQLEQTFNYAYFSTEWPSLNPEFFAHVFETPEHAYCPGRENVYGLPVVPMHFGFRAEVIDHLANTIMFTREYYDFNSNYSRIDYKNPPTGNGTIDNEVSPSSVINDFGTGVSYVIDKYSKACTVMPILSSEFDSVPVGEGRTRMRTPSEFFDFDHLGQYPYQYMGEHQVRGVPANSWISYRPFPDLSSAYNATWEWFFATKVTIIKAQDEVEDLEPLKLVIKSAEANVDMTYNVFRFSEKVPDPKYFDLRPCFENAGSRIFTMQLTGNWSTYEAENNIQLLRYWFQLSIDAFTGLRPIRVQDIEFEFFGKNIEVTFTMLGKAPIKGDIAGQEVDQVSLKLATARLMESFESGVFQVYYMPDPLDVTIFSPVPNTLRVVERKLDPTTTTPPPTKQTSLVQEYIKEPGLSSSAAAGLAIGILLLGAILGIVGGLVYRKFTTKPSGPSYVRQHEDE